MKYFFIALVLVGCQTIKKADCSNWSVDKMAILYQKDSVATLQAIEYSLDNKKLVKELTFKLLDLKHADKVTELIYFIHTKHPDWEIEIDYPTTNFKLNQ